MNVTVSGSVSLADVAAVVISVIALIAAVLANIKANKIQEKQLKIEEGREAHRVLSAQKALLTATLTRAPHDAMLSIYNSGDAAARDVEIRVDGKPIAEHQLIRDSARAIGIIGPSGQLHYGMMTFDGMPDVYHVEIRWRDDSPQEGKWESQLSF